MARSLSQNQDTQKTKFVLCIDAGEYPDDLKVRMVYQVLIDEAAAKSNYLRITDETREDYLYPANQFILIELPEEAEKVMLSLP